jgi:hypothetical protein
MEINDEIELRILNTMLIQARFYDNDYDLKDYYGSPYTGKIHKKIIDELRTKQFQGKNMYYPNDSDFSIEGYRDSSVWIRNIKKHIENIDNWKELSIEIRKAVVKDFIYPFTLNQKNFDKLVSFNL